jgi:protein involved in polysaccharide export with SLBB domain
MNLYSIKKITVCIICLALFLVGGESNAQIGGSTSLPAMKVGQMSDQQIMALWQQSQRSGLSENDAMNLLVKRGLPASEVMAFKRRLTQLQSKTRTGTTQSLIRDTSAFMKDTTWTKEVPNPRRKSDFYGFDFFNNPNPSFEPNLRITTPKGYVLGPEDDLTINYTGLNEATVDAAVSADGTIQIPYAGMITVSGLTIDQAEQKIKSRMTQAYPALASGRTKVFITLTNFKTIRVTVNGEAERPGTFAVSSLTSFFNVLYRAGGPTEIGSLRKIELIRNNKVIETIDFYAFLQNGLMGKDIRLEDQDIIHFPLYQKRVSLAGGVKRPAIYELMEKETLGELVRFGGGLDESAVKDVARVTQMGDKEMSIRDVPAADFNYFIPRNGDSVYFDKILSRFTNRVILSGAVYRPGNYELTDQLTLSKLIRKADGLKEDAFLGRGYIKRRQPDSDRELVPFNLANILNGKQADITLIREDSIFILSKDNIQDVPTITVAGNVRMPSTFQYREGMSLEDVILMAGGFTYDAATHKVEISRLEKNKADTLANQLISLITLDVDSSLQNQGRRTLLQPLDYVFVPRLLNYRNLGTVKIRGEALYAGDYALEKRNETVQEVIMRSGGISPFASMSDVQVFRKGLRVGTTLLADDSRQKEKFLLQPDDSIYIPKKDPFVEVQGAVFNPQIVSYESDNFMSYISDVGGITDKGNLKKAYIQYSNGISRQTRHFLFFRSYPKVLPGSKIIVPEKTESVRKGLSVFEISAILGALTSLVTVVSLLKK